MICLMYFSSLFILGLSILCGFGMLFLHIKESTETNDYKPNPTWKDLFTNPKVVQPSLYVGILSIILFAVAITLAVNKTGIC